MSAEETQVIPTVAPELGRTTLMDRVMSSGFNGEYLPGKVYGPKAAIRQRRANSRRMQRGAKQYGKSYYIPAGTKRFWAMLWAGSVLVGSALLTVGYITLLEQVH